MSTFREKPKPLEVVDARPFLGTHHSAHELVDWVMHKDANFVYYEFNVESDMPKLTIRSTFVIMSVTTGGYIVHKQKGNFVSMTKEELFEKYEQV